MSGRLGVASAWSVAATIATSGALEALATQRTADSVRGLLDLAPQRATRVLPDGREDTVDTESLAVGDVILVRPGGRVGADGVAVGGASELDQAVSRA
jgi:cation transport ATPase